MTRDVFQTQDTCGRELHRSASRPPEDSVGRNLLQCSCSAASHTETVDSKPHTWHQLLSSIVKNEFSEFAMTAAHKDTFRLRRFMNSVQERLERQ